MSILLASIGALFVIVSAVLVYRILTASVGEETIEEVKQAEKGFKQQ